MSKVTSKLQLTIPKKIAEAHGIEPGSEVIFESAGDVIRLRKAAPARAPATLQASRLRAFDQATARQAERNRHWVDAGGGPAADRGWRRDELYDRDLPR